MRQSTRGIDPIGAQGVLALGDSITNGGGELQWGVALQSWAQWTARGLGVPYTGHAIDGATVADVVEIQIPRFERDSARPDASFDVGCLYIGANDVRGADWDPEVYGAGARHALAWLAARCRRTLVCTLPLALGRPRAGTRVLAANRILADAARNHGALLVDLSDFGARNRVMADHVHPTAFGQIAIAERALAVLDRDGLPTRVRPSTLIAYETTQLGRLRGDWTYVYRHAKVSARALRAALGRRTG
jgi:lysophospholipase L1-like esterase